VLLRRYPDLPYRAAGLRHTIRPIARRLFACRQPVIAGVDLAGRRTIPLPRFAVDMLRARRRLTYLGEQTIIFPSTAGTLRDPSNFSRQWREARDELGASGVSTHSFRKTIATLIDDEGLSARIGADHLGHARVSMTQNVYMTRGRVHAQVADLLDRTVAASDAVINDE
jgi:integrase